MAEIFILALTALPNSMTVGTTTRGAMGILVNNNILYNGGSFKVGDFMTVNTSAASVWDLERSSYENIGLTPKITVKHDNNISDAQLAYLIEQLNFKL